MTSAIRPIRRNVLFFHSGALGDFIMTWPLAMAAGRLFAQSRVAYVTASQKGALAERALRLDHVDVETGWHALFAESIDPKTIDPRVTKWLNGAQLIISFVANEGDTWAANVRMLAPTTAIHFVNSKPPAGSAMHVTQHIAEQLKSIAPLHAGVEQMMKSISDRGINGVQQNPTGPIIIHPGSGAARKCWPTDRFVELASRAKKAGRDVRLVIGEVEREQWPAEQIARASRDAQLVEPRTLVELYDLIRTASCFVGNDTGPTHLAAISGVRTVAIFGTDPTEWRPIGPRVDIIAESGVENVTVDRVAETVLG